MGSRVHTLAWHGQPCALWPWHRQAMCTLGLGMGKPMVHTLALARADFGLAVQHFGLGRVHTLALAWAAVCTLALAMGKPCAHFGLGMGSRVHTLAWHGQPCAHLAWHRQACAHFGLGMGKPCAHFGLGTG
ncbi:hypothetical protein LWI29_022609 [Acer saccharum]|uniref:Uncharacterized protein n=1 Tax=Acer saccharum TaxID=4024 RepID=A0AA39VX95_ACESA|nr:hypothetical protein LWI29_022609 [Acer saccharum]